MCHYYWEGEKTPSHKCIKLNGSRDCFLAGGKVGFPWQNPFFSSRVQQQVSILQSQIPSGNYSIFFPEVAKITSEFLGFAKKTVEKYPWRCQFDQVVKGWSHPKWRFSHWILPQIFEGLVIIYIYIYSKFLRKGSISWWKKWHIKKKSPKNMWLFHFVHSVCNLLMGLHSRRRRQQRPFLKKCWEASRRFFFFGFQVAQVCNVL